MTVAPLTDYKNKYRCRYTCTCRRRGLTYIQQVPLVSPNDLLALPGKTAIITPRLCMFDIASHPTPGGSKFLAAAFPSEEI